MAATARCVLPTPDGPMKRRPLSEPPGKSRVKVSVQLLANFSDAVCCGVQVLPSGRGTSFHPVPRQSWQFSRGIVFVLKDRIRGRGEEGKRGCGRFVNQENSHP